MSISLKQLANLPEHARRAVARQMKGNPVPHQPRHVAGQMNKTEARYRDVLDGLRMLGQIEAYAFEAVTLKLARDCRYTPDFLVVKVRKHAALGVFVEFHEVKPASRKGYFARDDAKVKIKVAARLFPWATFYVVYPAKGGGWEKVRIEP